MKHTGRTRLLLILALASIISSDRCPSHFKASQLSPAPADSTALADLIIDTISYKRQPYGPSSFEFTMRVRNIGKADFPYKLYIGNTKSDRDIKMGHFSHHQLVYYASGKVESIPAGGFIVVRTEDVLFEDTKRVMFLIETDGKPHIKRTKIPKYPESNYENNTYELNLK